MCFCLEEIKFHLLDSLLHMSYIYKVWYLCEVVVVGGSFIIRFGDKCLSPGSSKHGMGCFETVASLLPEASNL